MALESYCRNVYGPQKLVDLSFVFIVIEDTAIDADTSSPDTTVTAAGSGVYDLTFPPVVAGYVVGAPVIGVAGVGQAEVVAFDATAGTMQIDTGSDLAGGDRCHVTLILSNQ